MAVSLACRATLAPLQRPRSAAGQGRAARRRLPVTQAAAQDGSSSSSSGGAPPVREVLSMQQRSKLETSSDALFYDTPRIVHHLDAGFRAQLTQLYRERIPEGADILDLGSSWVSHLPAEKKFGRVVGHGMNAAELARNPQLDEFFVRNLNESPSGWATADASFDAVLAVASVQYFQQPEAVFAEVRRVLRPGGVVIVSFSNRMFYQKCIAAWRDTSDYGRCQLVKTYLQAAGGFGDAEVVKGVPLPDGAQSPLEALQSWAYNLLSWGGGSSSDPFFAVVARRLDD